MHIAVIASYDIVSINISYQYFKDRANLELGQSNIVRFEHEGTDWRYFCVVANEAENLQNLVKDSNLITIQFSEGVRHLYYSVFSYSETKPPSMLMTAVSFNRNPATSKRKVKKDIEDESISQLEELKLGNKRMNREEQKKFKITTAMLSKEKQFAKKKNKKKEQEEMNKKEQSEKRLVRYKSKAMEEMNLRGISKVMKDLWSYMPNDLFLLIFSYIDYRTMISTFPCVCKNWHSLVKSHFIHKYLCQRRKWELPNGYEWKQLFDERYEMNGSNVITSLCGMITMSTEVEALKEIRRKSLSVHNKSTELFGIQGKHMFFIPMNQVALTPLSNNEKMTTLSIQFPTVRMRWNQYSHTSIKILKPLDVK